MQNTNQNLEQELQDILNNEKLPKEAKEKFINEYFDNYLKELDKELRNYLIKEYSIAALEIGSAIIPVSGIGSTGAKLGERMLTSKLGKKIIKDINKRILKSATSKKIFKNIQTLATGEWLRSKIGRKFTQDITAGVIEGGFAELFIGIADSLNKDEDFMISTLGRAISGMIGGGLLGGAGVYVERFMAAKKLKGYNFKTNEEYFMLSDELKSQYINDVKQFYKNYIQGIVVNNNGHIIYFPKNGAGEQLRWNPKQGKNFPDLVNEIKNSTNIRPAPKNGIKDKSNVSHYEVYSGKNGKHFIEVYKNNSRSYHITKDTPSSIDRVTNTGASESALAPKTKVSSANNIIPYIVPDVNANSGNNLNNIQVLKGHVEKNVDYNNEYAAASEENKEPEINHEYLKPIELEEDGTATGGAAGISDKFVNPNVYNKDSAEYPETSLGDDELPMPSEKKKFDFFENSMKELMKHTKRFSYDANAGKLDSISLINRKLDKINKTLESMQQQLDYHEKVVNIYNTPELATFYLYKPVENILASILEDYCIMEGIEILDT